MKTKIRKPIRRVSKSLAKRLREYRKAAAVWKAKPENKRCFIRGCANRDIDVHHIRGRLGALLMDERFWRPLCRRCHNYITDHPARAREMGLLPPLGEWNTRPKEDAA